LFRLQVGTAAKPDGNIFCFILSNYFAHTHTHTETHEGFFSHTPENT
jgi:hypothetical protein